MIKKDEWQPSVAAGVLRRRELLLGVAATAIAASVKSGVSEVSMKRWAADDLNCEAPYDPDPEGFYMSCSKHDDGHYYMSCCHDNRLVHRSVQPVTCIEEILDYFRECGLSRVVIDDWNTSNNFQKMRIDYETWDEETVEEKMREFVQTHVPGLARVGTTGMLQIVQDLPSLSETKLQMVALSAQDDPEYRVEIALPANAGTPCSDVSPASSEGEALSEARPAITRRPD